MTTQTRPKAYDTTHTKTLDHHVALAADLYSQVKQAHWTIVGPNFIGVHRLFDEQAAMLLAHIDLFAERMRALQTIPHGTIRMAARETPLPDLDARELPWREAVSEILQRLETYSASLRGAMKECEEHEDLGTQDIYIEAVREVDKHAYFLRSHLNGA